ncbi:hypothetical protein AVEN_216798-1, partial [Araneus ventricosus]
QLDSRQGDSICSRLSDDKSESVSAVQSCRAGRKRALVLLSGLSISIVEEALVPFRTVRTVIKRALMLSETVEQSRQRKRYSHRRDCRNSHQSVDHCSGAYPNSTSEPTVSETVRLYRERA